VKKQKSIAALKNDAMRSLQRLVRAKAALNLRSELIPCCDCGRLGHWLYEMDGGHFYSRKDSVGLMEENVHPQLKGCNLRMGRGDQKVAEGYRRFLVDLYGEEWLVETEQLAWKPRKFTRGELEDMRSEFELRRKAIEKELENIL